MIDFLRSYLYKDDVLLTLARWGVIGAALYVIFGVVIAL